MCMYKRAISSLICRETLSLRIFFFNFIPNFAYMRQFVAFETKPFFAIIKLCSVFTTELAILHDSSAITPPL